ncbi:GtrA family protein [Kitasatospora sp. NPDC059827]|uniref:GtrA family protein n=1 Tax=Kitasatospora sp. NPDC059827 TaxID=3346964 RepID=UPI0036473588
MQKVRGIRGEVVKFGIVGLSGVVVNFAVFWVCNIGLGIASLRSNIAATVIAIATNYLGYRYWLYRDRDADSRKREITLFLVFSGFGMLIETGVLGFSQYVLGLDSNFEKMGAKVVGLAIATVFRFVSYRTWVFKALPETAPVPNVPSPQAAHAAQTAQTARTGDAAEAADGRELAAQAELMLAAEQIRYAKAE